VQAEILLIHSEHTWAHICNPSYLGGRGKRLESLRSVRAKLARPYLKNKI
jgi:hypothetical protein